MTYEIERTGVVEVRSCIHIPCHIPHSWSILAFRRSATIRGDEWYGSINGERTSLTFLRRQKLQALAALRARDGNLSSMT